MKMTIIMMREGGGDCAPTIHKEKKGKCSPKCWWHIRELYKALTSLLYSVSSRMMEGKRARRWGGEHGTLQWPWLHSQGRRAVCQDQSRSQTSWALHKTCVARGGGNIYYDSENYGSSKRPCIIIIFLSCFLVITT